MKPGVTGVVFARGGSKGIPQKNIRKLAGKPLIAYAIEVAVASRLVDRIVVSTDDIEIANVAREYGAEVPFIRPKELAGDDSPEWAAWQHAIKALTLDDGPGKMDVFVSLPPTAPLRAPEDVDACVRTLLDSDADIVFAVRPAERNPYFNMVVMDEAGYAQLVIPPDRAIHQRQAAPAVYDMTTVVYAARPDFVLAAKSIFEGKAKAITVPAERAIDIDTELDFQIAEFLLSRLSTAR